MLPIFGFAGVAALKVASYTWLRGRSPDAAAATTRTVRELAAVVLVCTRAIKGVIDVLPGTTPGRSMSPPRPAWGTSGHAGNRHVWDYDELDEDPS